MRSLRTRLERLAGLAIQRQCDDRFTLILLCPVAEAHGRPLGLHRDGPKGSSVGVLVYDPAAGEPQVPDGRLTGSALVIGGEIGGGLLDELVET